MKKELLESILNALPYEIVFCDRNHTIQYLNKTAKQHYGERIHIGDSIFNCHNQESKKKIMNFLEKADAGSGGNAPNGGAEAAGRNGLPAD